MNEIYINKIIDLISRDFNVYNVDILVEPRPISSFGAIFQPTIRCPLLQ